MIRIDSLQALKAKLEGSERVFLLLYKEGTENSKCAFESLQKAAGELKDLVLLYADVSTVRDIHPEYGIKTAPSLLHFEKGMLKNEVKGCNSEDFYTQHIQQKVAKFAQAENGPVQPRVTVYTTQTCPHCTTLKNHLRHHGIRYTDIDVSKDATAAQQMVARSGQQGVPQADIGGRMVVGFDKKKINELLNIQAN